MKRATRRTWLRSIPGLSAVAVLVSTAAGAPVSNAPAGAAVTARHPAVAHQPAGARTAAAGKLAGGRVTLATCHGHESQLWFPAPASQLITVATGMCLSDPAAGGAGTALVQQDCYGDPGQVWALN